MSTRSVSIPDDVHAEQQLVRLYQAQRDLERIDTVDLRLRVDNALLQPAIEASLADAFERVPGWTSERLVVEFHSGYVAVEVTGQYATPEPEPPTDDPAADQDISEGPPGGESSPSRFRLFGDVLLNQQTGRISWHPEFHDLAALDRRPGASDDVNALEKAYLLERLETGVRAGMAATGNHSLTLDPMPLGVLETGIRLRTPFQSVSTESSLLEGVLTTAGAAVLVEPETTSFALDLGFVPGLPNCQASVDVGRIVFAGNVSNREPENTAVLEGTEAQTRYFFTDIVGARAETTVVHYWLADGQPASVTELRVGPSARWRTWSERPDGLTDVRRWQVLVIEKTTGCILDQQTIVLAAPRTARNTASGEPADASVAFAALQSAFAEHTSAFPPMEELTGAVAVDVRPAFFSSTVSEALYDLRLVFSTPVRTSRPIGIRADLAPFPEDALSCDLRDCETSRICTVDFDDCPVRRDNRDCRSCLFRNPLNNRCMREAEDPICIAARDAENLRLEERRQACIDDQTRQRDACIVARDRELASCRARATRERADCTSQADAIASRRASGQPMAGLNGSGSLAGTVTAEFSEFRVTEDLRQIRMQLSLDADLVARGALAFEPDPGLEALAGCLGPLQTDFETPLNLPDWQAGLATRLEASGGSLQANWSGLLQDRSVYPSLIETLLDAHPDLFERCALEFDASQVDSLLSGSGAELLRGVLSMDIQPEPTRITLLPAYLETGSGTWVGDPVIGESSVTYRLTELSPGQD
jgi:hypothetical protein